MQFLHVNGVTLHYQIEGATDGLPLVFLHSLGCDMRTWDAVVAHLSPHFPVVRLDIRGHGLSDAPPAPYSMAELAGDLHSLLDALDVEEAVLVGVSVGGMIALQAALDFPKRVKGLVLLDTAARIATPEFWNDRISTLREHGMPYLAEPIISRWFTGSFIESNPATYQGFYNLLARMSLDGYIGMCAALRDADLRDQVRHIGVPALVLCGTEDLATTPETMRGLAEGLADAQFELIEDAGHLPPVEQPEIVANAIMRFLEEHGYAGR